MANIYRNNIFVLEYPDLTKVVISLGLLNSRYPATMQENRIWNSIADYEISRNSNLKLEENVDFEILRANLYLLQEGFDDSFQVAKNLAMCPTTIRQMVMKSITMNDLYQGMQDGIKCRSWNDGQKNSTKLYWTDIVLPPAIMALLKDICNVVKYKGTVYYEWGFDAKVLTW